MTLSRWQSRNKCRLVGIIYFWDTCQRKGSCCPLRTAWAGTLNLAAGRNRIHSALKAMTLLVRANYGLEEINFSINTKMKRPRNLSMESAELRHYHSNPRLHQSSDPHYCNSMTLNKLLQSHPSVRQRWLKRLKTSRAAYLKDGQNQQTIGKYMTPIPQARGTHNEQETRLTQPTHRERCKDTNTTQQRMTAYFAGRPPDIIAELSQNPPPSQVWRDAKVGYKVSPWKSSYKRLTFIFRLKNKTKWFQAPFHRFSCPIERWSFQNPKTLTNFLIAYPAPDFFSKGYTLWWRRTCLQTSVVWKLSTSVQTRYLREMFGRAILFYLALNWPFTSCSVKVLLTEHLVPSLPVWARFPNLIQADWCDGSTPCKCNRLFPARICHNGNVSLLCMIKIWVKKFTAIYLSIACWHLAILMLSLGVYCLSLTFRGFHSVAQFWCNVFARLYFELRLSPPLFMRQNYSFGQ